MCQNFLAFGHKGIWHEINMQKKVVEKITNGKDPYKYGRKV